MIEFQNVMFIFFFVCVFAFVQAKNKRNGNDNDDDVFFSNMLNSIIMFIIIMNIYRVNNCYNNKNEM